MLHYLKKFGFLLGVLIGIFLLNVELTAVNMALIYMARALHVKIGDTDLIITVMLFSFAAVIVIAGRMADIYGYYKVVMFGLCIFLIGAVISGFAVDMLMMLAGRLLQGVGAGLCSSNFATYVYVTFPEERRGLVTGLTMGTVGLAIACGPLFGGICTQILTWRWIFWIDLPIGLLAILLIKYLRPKLAISRIDKKLDIFGLIMMMIIMISIMLSLQNVRIFAPVRRLFPLIAFAGILFFYIVEIRKKQPLIDFNIFRNSPAIVIGCIARFMSILAFWIILFVSGIYLEHNLGYSPVKAGLILMPMTLLIGFLSPLSGTIIDKTGTRILNVAGLTGFIISSLFLYLFSFNHSSWTIFILMLIVFGLSYSISSTSLLHFTLKEAPENSKGVIGAIYYMITLLGGIIGLPLVKPYITIHAINLAAVAEVCFISSIIGLMVLISYYLRKELKYIFNRSLSKTGGRFNL